MPRLAELRTVVKCRFQAPKLTAANCFAIKSLYYLNRLPYRRTTAIPSSYFVSAILDRPFCSTVLTAASADRYRPTITKYLTTEGSFTKYSVTKYSVLFYLLHFTG